MPQCFATASEVTGKGVTKCIKWVNAPPALWTNAGVLSLQAASRLSEKKGFERNREGGMNVRVEIQIQFFDATVPSSPAREKGEIKCLKRVGASHGIAGRPMQRALTRAGTGWPWIRRSKGGGSQANRTKNWGNALLAGLWKGKRD